MTKRLIVRIADSTYEKPPRRGQGSGLDLKAGAPITYVAAQLGRTKPATTLPFYAKYLPEKTRRFVDRLDAWEPVDQARP